VRTLGRLGPRREFGQKMMMPPAMQFRRVFGIYYTRPVFCPLVFLLTFLAWMLIFFVLL
jgi:hypothetical protein